MSGSKKGTPMKGTSRRSPRIVVLDGDPAILDYVKSVLDDRFSVTLLTEAQQLRKTLQDSPCPDLLLMDWNIVEDESEENALGLLAKIHDAKPTLPIVMFACSAELNEVIAATHMGAASVILKPFRKADIDLAVEQCLSKTERPAAEPDVEEIPLNENTSFVRSCKRMREIESQCTLVARADIPVLILGESGTGKEVAAMLIHKLSARNQQNFLKVNCAAMPADLLESELFGYEQGAFTGAVKSKPGKFEICDHGTILLDEIGEMPPVLQAKLLQVLQDGTFSRLGSRNSVKVDVRIIAATNIDIKAAIAQKTFREDLYYRLNGFTLRMPPLRERTEEIPILAEHFMRKISTKYQCNPLPFSPALMQSLSGYSWPGNLRELENTVKRYLVLADENSIIEELTPTFRTAPSLLNGGAPENEKSLKSLVRSLKGGAEAAAIAQSLEGSGWNRKAAAVDLQISYKALLYKIKQYNLSPPARRQQASAGKTNDLDRVQSA
jgi:two-component system, NtrC family, response regulator AtoC